MDYGELENRESVSSISRVGYKMSEPGYESSGYERSMGPKRLDTVQG